MLPTLAHPERVAAAAIRGYLFQAVGIARRWLSLAPAELLLCEGDEDLDHFLLDEHGVVRDVTQTQFKDLEGAVSVRSDAVQGTLFNFLRAYATYAEKQESVRFVFATSADRARQRIGEADPRNRVQLSIDVLSAWQSLDDAEDRSWQERRIVVEIKKLADAARPQPNGPATAALGDHAELERALVYLDDKPGRWSDFLGRVEWRLGQGTVQEQLESLQEAVSKDARTRALEPRNFAKRLTLEVLEASAQSDTRLRVLSRDSFDRLAKDAASDLEAWAQRARTDRFSAWVSEYDRLGALTTEVAAHTAQLAAHESRLSTVERVPLDKLRKQSARDFGDLVHSRVLKLGSLQVSVNRAVVPLLASAALDGSIVVVGDAGSGKSAVLAAVSEEFRVRGFDVVVLAADSAHGFGPSLIDTLEEWPGDKPALLIVDALDQVRDYEKAKSLHNTLGRIVESAGRWRVVAAIRSFDLGSGSSVAKVFAGAPPTAHSDPRFTEVRHVLVGAFSDEELKQLDEIAPRLAAAFGTAPAELKNILRIPFYLSLAASLLDRGLEALALNGARSATDLLSLYWERRVADHPPAREAREGLLRQVCARMMMNRELHVEKAMLSGEHLYDLLTGDVLREVPSRWTGHGDERVAFSHAILFDYAVARLCVPRRAEQLGAMLEGDEQLLIIIRPSLDMTMHILWRADAEHELFWRTVIQLSRYLKRPLGRIIGPTVAARAAIAERDLEPLLRALTDGDGLAVEAVDATLNYLVGALLPLRRGGQPISAGPWAELADRIALIDRPIVRQCCRRLLFELTEAPSLLTTEQLGRTGHASRAIFAVGQPGDLVRAALPYAIRFVCRTFASDAAASAACVRAALDDAVLRGDAYAVIPAIARETCWLLSDPAVVEKLYVTSFRSTEDSTESTNFGGLVLPLTSNRRQDHQHGLWELKEAFPAFMRAAPLEATRAMVGVIDAFVEQQHPHHDDRVIAGTFTVGDRVVRFRTDYSEIWDDSEHENALTIADTWESVVGNLAAEPSNGTLVSRLFEACLDTNRLAFVWRRWLKISRRPESAAVVGPVVAALLASRDVLMAYDTTGVAEESLRVIFPLLDVAARASIERAILSTRKDETDDEDTGGTFRRLLGALDPASTVTADAVTALEQVAARGGAINRPSRSRRPRGFVEVKEYTTDDWLRREGAALDEEPNKALRAQTRALLAQRNALPEQPSQAALADLVNMLGRTSSAIDVLKDAHPSVVDDAWGEIGEAVVRLAMTLPVVEDAELRTKVIEMAVAVARCPCPRPRGSEGTETEGPVGWGNPHARGEAAVALCAIAAATGDEEAVATLEDLTKDVVPTVRLRAVRHLSQLVPRSPETVWRIADRVVSEEVNSGVLMAIVTNAFQILAHLDAARITQYLEEILERVQEGKGAQDLRRIAYEILTEFHLAGAEPRASAIILSAITRPDSPDVLPIIHRLRSRLVPTSHGSDTADERRRARDLIAECVRRASEAFAQRSGSAPLTEKEIESGRAVARVLDACAMDLYFASGAFGRRHPSEGSVVTYDEADLSDFLDEHVATFERLVGAAIPAVVHSVIETLEHLARARPREAFRLIATAVSSANDGGYHIDPLGADAVVRIVMWLLAEHRDLLQADRDLQHSLLDVLDVLVSVAWPQALEVAYGLHGMFR